MKKPAVFHILLKHPQVTPKLADIIVKYGVFKKKFHQCIIKFTHSVGRYCLHVGVHDLSWYPTPFLRVRKIEKATKWLLALSCQSVCPTARPSIRLCLRRQGTTRIPLVGFSWNFTIGYFSKICPKNSIQTRTMATLNEGLCTFVIASRWILLSVRNVSDKSEGKIKTHLLCSVSLFSENRAV